MNNPLKDLLPNTAKEVAPAAAEKLRFKSAIKLPKGAMKGMCSSAIDKVLLKKQTLEQVSGPLTATEFDYVCAVLSEYDQFLVVNGYAKATTLRDDKMLQEEAAKAIAESGS